MPSPILYNGGTLSFDGNSIRRVDGLLAAYREVPVGAVVKWFAVAIPTGWLSCNGAAVSRTTYADLFAVLGTTQGAGNGTTTFNIPTEADHIIRT